jgi:hypothetical protein
MNSSLLGLEFLSGFHPHFSVLQNTIREIEFSCFAEFFVRIFKPKKSIVFFTIRQ